MLAYMKDLTSHLKNIYIFHVIVVIWGTNNEIGNKWRITENYSNMKMNLVMQRHGKKNGKSYCYWRCATNKEIEDNVQKDIK